MVFHVSAQQVKHESLAQFLAKGKVSGKTRFYFMATDNESPLTDYHALGIGAGIGYTTPTYKGFSAGISGFYMMNVFSSDLSILDPITQNPNRYELGLFDVTEPENKKNLSRLENFYIQFEKKKIKLKYGQYTPKYLFINPQDGRMSPTMTRGLEVNWKNEQSNLMVAYIHGISPRSTVSWYKVSDTFGIYPSGRATDGTAGNYQGNIETPGIVLAEWNQKIEKGIQLKMGSMSVLNIFQTWYTNVGIAKNGWKVNAMGIYQHPLNPESNQSYLDEDEKSLVFSGQIAKEINKWHTSINYTRIADKGRFLMPREWGREPFYTFLPRERNEGASDVHAASLKIQNTLSKELSLNLGIGKYWLPDASDASKNKYAMPSYNQINVEANYVFNGWLEGGSIKTLFVRKIGTEDTYQNPKVVFNKVNMNTLNIIFNYTF
ncbi:hypothetical protein DJ013_03205 [Arcticibacterium luteifluviistationis]|uniref:Outer membrane porin, OprD family n=1 Tax=Arcticibacterium luteifluviistationis TaxID=1784714 RepID=A0A2Z4G802_9BACT|nr:hypothetical protein DJ013_03205 [Arcticibacterium luteifluviistationis]